MRLTGNRPTTDTPSQGWPQGVPTKRVMQKEKATPEEDVALPKTVTVTVTVTPLPPHTERN